MSNETVTYSLESVLKEIKDVLKTQHSAKWIEAINIEVDSLINNFTFLIAGII